MEPLMISVSGVRGVVGESLTPEVLSKFAAAYGTFISGGKVIVGTDSRLSREMCKHAVFSGLISVGCEIIDLGLVPTPTVQLMVEKLKAAGGIAITASHNPAEWNALKFFTREGIFFNTRQSARLITIYEQERIKRARWDNMLGKVKENHSAFSIHIEKILSYLDVDLIRRKRLRVALDCVNGAGSMITPLFLRRLGCRVVKINCQVNEPFPHPPEPLPENLSGLSSLVKQRKADIGFAQDADADRLAIVSEKGVPLGEEYSLALATQFILRKKKGAVVVNLSTSQMVDDIAQESKSRAIRTKVGEINVVEGMKKHRALIGGEGNGGVIDPRAHYGRDSLAGMGLILQYLASSGKSISALAESLPLYHLVKRKIRYSGDKKKVILETIERKFSREKLDRRDGIKIIRESSWA
ncbi:phosphoglucosamine mutase, partial [candidate division NPL-UPA2 bacterium]|nr:phosphoglucosamine mutase [candidate division NPL-UPA2 bacterium]